MVNKKYILAALPFVVILSLFLLNWLNNGHLPATGEVIYQRECAHCHMEEGQGIGRLYPPLAQSDYLNEHWDSVICIIKNGLNGSIMVNQLEYNKPMDGIRKLTAIDLNNLLNYLATAWANELPHYTLKQVKTSLHKCSEEKTGNNQ